MAGASTPQGAAADTKAEQSDQTADVEVSASGVEVSPTVSADYEPVTMYRADVEKTAETLEQFYALKFDGYSDRKPSKSTKKS